MGMELLKEIFEEDAKLKSFAEDETGAKKLDIDKWEQEAYQSGNFGDRVDIIEQNAQILAKKLLKKNLKSMFEAWKLLTYLYREAIRNAPEHGKANEVLFETAMEEQDGHTYVEFKVSDHGIGIYKSLSMNTTHRSYLENDEEALLWAVKPGISKAFSPGHNGRENDPNANSGYGLFMISQIVKMLGGSMILASGKSALYLDQNMQNTRESDFTGTLLSVQIPVEEVHDYQQLIDDARRNGEAAAKEIKQAFKEASLPSKGLLHL